MVPYEKKKEFENLQFKIFRVKEKNWNLVKNWAKNETKIVHRSPFGTGQLGFESNFYAEFENDIHYPISEILGFTSEDPF